MEEFLIRLLQFIMSISLLILLHEGGHFFFSKLFGVRVEKFYLFFDPWFHLFEWKPRKSDTTYGLGWLPLGGYCKISGMIDESMDTEQMKQPPQPYEFRSKPAWQRLLIMIGGVLVNFLLALFIYSMVLFYWGDNYIATKDMSHGMKFNSEAKRYGFKDGDILLGTNEKAFTSFDIDLYRQLSTATRVDIVRNGKPMSISLPGDLNLLDMIKTQPSFVRPLVPAVIDSVSPAGPAMKAGIRKGDRILALNGKPVDSWNAFMGEVAVMGDVLSAARTPADSMRVRNIELVYLSKATGTADTVRMVMNPNLQMGVVQTSIFSLYKPTHLSYGFLESFPAGVGYGMGVLKGYVDDMKYVFTAEGAKSIGGFGSIGSLFPAAWDWMVFWKMTAFLSIILAFMNILPIPALDGGHVLFLLYEIIARRKPSEKFMIWAEYIGIGILLTLMIVANLNDVLRFLGIM
ncbi:MAG: RIP metalloprotease RseP [Prevotellaceae bacterium]|nr:RIP metalloprotease RseP [Prevotellaceae bacterium]